MSLPAVIGDYTDFYASIFHATNVGPDAAARQAAAAELQVRADRLSRTSLVDRGERYARAPATWTVQAEASMEPSSCRRGGSTTSWKWASCRAGNALGAPIPIARGRAHLFGVCLLNDWSARDIQAWEYQPLGPFLAQELRHDDFTVGRDARGAGAVPRAGALRGRTAIPRRCPISTTRVNAIGGRPSISPRGESVRERMRDDRASRRSRLAKQPRDLYWTPRSC